MLLASTPSVDWIERERALVFAEEDISAIKAEKRGKWREQCLPCNLNSWPSGTVITVAVSPSPATADNAAVSSLMFTPAPPLALSELVDLAGEVLSLPPPPLLFFAGLGIY